MADAFRKLGDLPPLRLTASDLAQIGDELAAQMSSGGKVDVSYEVGFGDGTNFERDSSAGFLSNLDSEGEPLDQVILSIMAWAPPAHGIEILKSVQLQFRPFGSQFHVNSTDPMWGKGAVQTIKKRFSRHRPWYAPLLKTAPFVIGAVAPLPIFFIAVAASHEQRLSGLLIVVVALSLLVLAGNAWVWRQQGRRHLFANTVILRAPRSRNWQWLKVLVGAVAFAANVGTLIVLLAR